MSTSISVPNISNVGNTYILSWKDSGIQMKMTRLVEKAETVSAEVVITKAGGHLYSARANLLSPTAKKTLASEMATRVNGVDWRIILEQAFTLVLQKYREGEPLSELWTSDEIPPPQFLLQPIIYKGLPTIIFGEKGVCKSTLALIIYTCLTLPWLDNPLGWKTLNKPTKTILLDYEVDRDISQYYAKQIQVGMELPPFPIYHRRGRRPFADDIEQIEKYILQIGAEVIIIDSLGPAVGGDLNNPEQALKLTTAIRQLGCAALIIGQTSKDREIKHKSVYGSTYFEYFSRNIFELRKDQEESEDEMDIALYQTYCNLSKKIPPMGFHLNFKDGIKIEKTPITLPELVARMGTKARILDLLKKGSITAKTISETLEVKRDTINQTLNRLKQQNMVVYIEDKWGLKQWE